MQDQIVLEARNVSKTVPSPEGALTILADVSLSVRAGETLAIVGASGAGKSTLLALLAGLDSPSTGRVSIAGVDLTQLDEDGRAAIRGRHVGFVFQSFHLIPSLTALENVMLPLELGNRSDARQVAVHALAQVGLGPRAAHYPVVNSSALPSLALSSPIRPCCLPMSPPAIWTPPPVCASPTCCSSSTALSAAP
jgi:putative ABC transport system ATP-binding protein